MKDLIGEMARLWDLVQPAKKMNKYIPIAASLAPVLMVLSASDAGAAETYKVDYLEIEECEYDQVATVFSNGWVFVCEDYQYPYHYGSAVLIVDHHGYGGAKLCLSGSVCLKGRIE
ncbi:hypothetical protein CVM52_04460 [Pseudooceanicola lipolyticus]|uniref:Uncharacterized protein n=1 Tax=Pseudooceanicola lipolyticus TaxID=2029104 RepID=A0A2M8J541_9RHOB|nr:hypothetical protein [Pseudooceanicola lipolyticus]PJE37888.1 hypothetical protein CVM52_04460 [Pseudooceanicola lipolyticus]